MDRSPILSPKDPSASFARFTVTLTTARTFAGAMLAGQLDITGCEILEAALSRLESTGSDRFVVDLSRLSFLDCAGLETLLAFDERCRAGGRTLALIPGPSGVQRIFQLTGAEDRLSFTSQGSGVGLPWRRRRGRDVRTRGAARGL